ncbi:MAG: hypothetical protein L0331_15860, partial [Chloroflexi bacterium]|nr:hypothetical protein [Chloroflexota bacterium]
MGHIKLGTIPKSKKWSVVVSEVMGEGGAGSSKLLTDDVEHIASKTIEAAQGGLKQAINDAGLQYTFYLLTQIVLLAREKDWYESLPRLGIRISGHNTLFDLTAEMQAAIDDYLSSQNAQTDI